MNRQVVIRKAWSITVICVVTLFCLPAIAKYSGGTGEPNDPYQIATDEDLNDIGNHIEDFNKCFIMTADINLNPSEGITVSVMEHLVEETLKVITDYTDFHRKMKKV